MEAFWSVIMEAFRVQFTTTELLSYNEVLYDEATEEWYTQSYPDEVDCEERNCMRLVRHFSHLMKDYRCTLPITNTKCSSTSRKLPLARVLYVRQSLIIYMMIKR